MGHEYDPVLHIDTARLLADLERFGLMDKTMRSMNRDDLRALAHSIGNAVHDTEPPCWETDSRGVRTLRIPFTAPVLCKWWLHKDHTTALSNLLHSMGATAGEYKKYMGRDETNSFPTMQTTP